MRARRLFSADDFDAPGPEPRPIDDRDPSAVLAEALRDEADFADAFDDDARETSPLFDVCLVAAPIVLGLAALWIVGAL